MRWSTFAFLMIGSLSWASGTAPVMTKITECGVYRLHGRLRDKDGGISVLELNPGTTSRTDVLLHQLSADSATGYRNKNVELEVEVYQLSGGGHPTRARVLKPAKACTQESLSESPVFLLKKKACD